MKLWLIGGHEIKGFDMYHNAVVAAKTEDDARQICPDGRPWPVTHGWYSRPEDVPVEYLGTAKAGTKAGTVICASYTAG